MAPTDLPDSLVPFTPHHPAPPPPLDNRATIGCLIRRHENRDTLSIATTPSGGADARERSRCVRCCRGRLIGSPVARCEPRGPEEEEPPQTHTGSITAAALSSIASTDFTSVFSAWLWDNGAHPFFFPSLSSNVLVLSMENPEVARYVHLNIANG